MIKTTVEDFKNGMYCDENGNKLNWKELVNTVQDSAGGTCSSIQMALESGLRYYTGGEIEDMDELPDELQSELYEDMHYCPVCEWICYPGDIRCCDDDNEDEEEEE